LTIGYQLYARLVIWGTWIPYSQIELDTRNDYECYTDKFLGINNVNSQIELYVPIK